MVFPWSLSDSKSPQVSRTHLRIPAVLSNTVIWIVSTRPPTSKSSWPFNNPLDILPKVPITIGIIVTFMFDSFFNSLARSRYLFFFSHSFRFILWSARTAKSTILQILIFFCWLLWGLVFWPGLGDSFFIINIIIIFIMVVVVVVVVIVMVVVVAVVSKVVRRFILAIHIGRDDYWSSKSVQIHRFQWNKNTNKVDMDILGWDVMVRFEENSSTSLSCIVG